MKIAFEKREKKKAVSFYLSQPLTEEIRKISKKEQVTMSDVVEKLLRSGVNAYHSNSANK